MQQTRRLATFCDAIIEERDEKGYGAREQLPIMNHCRDIHVETSRTIACELLAPAGSLEKLKTAIAYGADAVYLGGRDFSLRAHAANFTLEEMAEGISFAHRHGARVFVTVNIFAHNRDLGQLPAYLAELRRIGADALIISDPGVLRIARRTVPEMKLHLSTQANVTNEESALFWQEQGVNRLNLARELSLAEIHRIKQVVGAKVEVFVHGALCISYSGRCMLSLYLTGRDANQGKCAHPCRYSYQLREEKRPGQLFPVEEDQRGTYIFNSKDLCLINRLPHLLAAGVDSIKIEGRMKGIYYVGGIVRIYRAALDHTLAGLKNGCQTAVNDMPSSFMEEIDKLGTRGYTENFFNGAPGEEEMCYGGAVVEQNYVPALLVLQNGSRPLVEARHRIRVDDTLEYMAAGIDNIPFRVLAMRDQEGRPLEQANPGIRFFLDADRPIDWHPFTLARRVREQEER